MESSEDPPAYSVQQRPTRVRKPTTKAKEAERQAIAKTATKAVPPEPVKHSVGRPPKLAKVTEKIVTNDVVQSDEKAEKKSSMVDSSKDVHDIQKKKTIDFENNETGVSEAGHLEPDHVTDIHEECIAENKCNDSKDNHHAIDEPSEVELACAAVLEIADSDSSCNFELISDDTETSDHDSSSDDDSSEEIPKKDMILWLWYGQASDQIRIDPEWNYDVMCGTIAAELGLPPKTLALTYEAPCELADRKRKSKGGKVACDMYVRNANDNSSGNGATTKVSSRSKQTNNGPLGLPGSIAKSEEAKLAVRDALSQKVSKISAAFDCRTHRRPCYTKYDGRHGVYSMENMKVHAQLLLSETRGVTVHEVPEQIKLLDFHKPSKASRAQPDGSAFKFSMFAETGVAESSIYPTMTNWLRMCQGDPSRAETGMDYEGLAQFFKESQITRITDLANFTWSELMAAGKAQGTDISAGLAMCMTTYAKVDVAAIKGKSRE
ncbi:hypothetical protein ACEPAH_3105 [Sanghuangporus vaninii]